MWISAGALTLLAAAVAAFFAWRAGPLSGRSAAAVAPGARRWPARIAAALLLPLSAFFFYAWYAFYWKWDFNELGRYYDPVDQVVYTSSGFVWVVPAALLLAAGLLCAWRGWRR
ncbi:hypothetical protein [Achromobacter marplatensis]|uniref:hypothetical protein n=1 Tax=Achromobacter marplatensis TaxID=470868 RepID=UPI0039F6AEF5